MPASGASRTSIPETVRGAASRPGGTVNDSEASTVASDRQERGKALAVNRALMGRNAG